MTSTGAADAYTAPSQSDTDGVGQIECSLATSFLDMTAVARIPCKSSDAEAFPAQLLASEASGTAATAA